MYKLIIYTNLLGIYDIAFENRSTIFKTNNPILIMIDDVETNRSFKKPIMILIIYLTVDVIGNAYKDKTLIYVLLWLHPDFSPTWNEEIGQLYFYNKHCRFKNCFLTPDYEYFNNIREFDVIVFNSWTLLNFKRPSTRFENQTYILFSEESPSICPVPQNYSGYFNLTWTYKLDSDISLKFLIIKNNKGEVIGPRKKMQWIQFENMEPPSNYIKRKLENKNKAAAWFVTHCITPGKREEFVEKLNGELNKYNLRVDIFGKCGSLQCPMHNEECHALVESDYYFYLAFENSLCEDYVTEKVLTATKHFAVPIVYGGANYNRYVIA